MLKHPVVNYMCTQYVSLYISITCTTVQVYTSTHHSTGVQSHSWHKHVRSVYTVLNKHWHYTTPWCSLLWGNFTKLFYREELSSPPAISTLPDWRWIFILTLCPLTAGQLLRCWTDTNTGKLFLYRAVDNLWVHCSLCSLDFNFSHNPNISSCPVRVSSQKNTSKTTQLLKIVLLPNHYSVNFGKYTSQYYFKTITCRQLSLQTLSKKEIPKLKINIASSKKTRVHCESIQFFLFRWDMAIHYKPVFLGGLTAAASK